MANNCLVTKLNGTVDNDSLLTIKEFFVNITKIGSSFIPFDAKLYMKSIYAPVIMTIIGDGYFKQTPNGDSIGKSVTIATNVSTTYYYSDGDYRIKIGPKSALTSCEIYGKGASMDVKQIAYTLATKIQDANRYVGEFPNNLTNVREITGLIDTISSSNSIVTLDALKTYPNLSRVEWDNKIMYGDIATFTRENFTSLTSFTGGSTSQNQLYGNLEEVSIPFTRLMINSGKITGTIEGFVATQRKAVAEGGAGRSSFDFGNNLRFFTVATENNITFQGQPIPRNKNVFLSWTANTITFEGVTINA